MPQPIVWIITARCYVSVVYARPCVRLSVRLSVFCLSQVEVLSERLNLSSCYRNMLCGTTVGLFTADTLGRASHKFMIIYIHHHVPRPPISCKSRQFRRRKSIKKCDCESAHRQTDRQTHALTETNWIYNLSHAICYSYGADNTEKQCCRIAQGL